MASIKEAVNTAGTFTITLASLTNGSARQSTAIDNSSGLYEDAEVTVKIKTNAAGTSATGSIEVYAIGTVDGGTTYTDGGGASDAAITINAARLIGTFPAVANATTYIGGPYSVAKAFDGWLPTSWAIAVKNNSGATLDSTGGNHAAKYQEFYHTVA